MSKRNGIHTDPSEEITKPGVSHDEIIKHAEFVKLLESVEGGLATVGVELRGIRLDLERRGAPVPIDTLKRVGRTMGAISKVTGAVERYAEPIHASARRRG